jgi:predicted phosphodiesterase
MKLGRRSFLVDIMLAAGAASAAPLVKMPPPKGEPKLKMGVVTDTHFGTGWIMGVNTPATEKAFQYFRERGADVVMGCGDLIDSGTLWQFRALAKTWNDVFPDNKGKDGKKVEKIFVCGNHEIAHWMPVERQNPKHYLLPRIEENWKKILGEEYSPVYHKCINSIHFIGVHWGWHNKPEVIEPVLEKVMKEVKPTEPVFLCQHYPVKGTCFGSGKGVCAAGKLYRKYPNLITITGHTHTPVTIPGAIWQKEFTAINAGVVTWTDFKPYTWPNNLAPSAVYAKNALFVSVYDDRIVIERYDLTNEAKMGGDWTIPLPLNPATFPYTAEKKDKLPLPSFASNAKVTVNRSMEPSSLLSIPPKRRPNWDSLKPGILVSFDAAIAPSEENRVMRYDIKVVREDNGEEILTESLFTEFYLAPSRMRNAYDHIIDGTKLPVDVSLRCIVTAYDCLERKCARSLESKSITLRSYKYDVN